MSGHKLALIGMGKMGRAIAQMAEEQGFHVVATIDPANTAGATISRASLNGADVAIEFTVPGAAEANVRACIAAQCPVVCGTTGWYDALPAVEDATRAAGGALLVAPNFSVGVALFRRMVLEAARLVGGVEGFESHLVETHHSAKKDAPSGTAAMLASVYGEAAHAPLPVTSVRVGSVPGTHELIIDGAYEQIRLVHEARDRRVFASGALTAARWLIGRTGTFSLDDVISLPPRDLP